MLNDQGVESLSVTSLLEREAGIRVTVRRSDVTLAAVVLERRDGSPMILIERTYREGVRCILHPTPQEIAAVRDDDLWDTWNSDRAILLCGIV